MYHLFILLFFVQALNAQHPYKHFTEAIDVRYDSHQPVVDYVLRVDSTDLSLLQIEMHLRNIPDSFRIAMFVHPEYDDRYFRFIENMHVRSKEGEGSIKRVENTLWNINIKGNEATIFYSLRLPKTEGERGAWRPFLSASGGLIGGPQCYFYIPGATLAPANVHLQIPQGWTIATGLQATSEPYTFFAPTINALFDAPIFVGKTKQWRFEVEGVPHRVVYWPSDNASIIDSLHLVDDIEKLVKQASLLFGRLPYREYTFLFQDSSWGALEHTNSVTLGLPASMLAANLEDYLSDIAHEYFHTWNLMRIRPYGYGVVDYHKPPLSKGLWWSEGLTMFYADLLMRRAGLVSQLRTEHLANLIERYVNNPAHYEISAERLSMSAYAAPGYLGDYDGSTHLQGEVFGNMFDMLIRSSSEGTKSMDDVMRRMMEDFSGEKGFEGKDIEKIIGDVTGQSVHGFFDDHIRGNKMLDFNKFLLMIGLRASITWKDAEDEKRQLEPDIRVHAYTSPDEKHVLLLIVNPTGIWKRAGLMTGDEMVTINGSAINTTRDFYSIIRRAKINDRLSVQVKRNGVLLKKEVWVLGYKYAAVVIEEIKTMSANQRKCLEQWKAGL
ncbi:MAG: PDZ domain-containing protein [Flavisolibacter sp.]